MVTTDLPHFAGTSCRPCQRYTVNVLSAWAWPYQISESSSRTRSALGRPSLTSALGYEHRQGSHFTLALDEQRSQAAIRPERGYRRISRAGGLCSGQPDTVRYEARLLLGQLQAAEHRTGGRGQRNELELGCQLIKRLGIFHQVG